VISFDAIRDDGFYKTDFTGWAGRRHFFGKHTMECD